MHLIQSFFNFFSFELFFFMLTSKIDFSCSSIINQQQLVMLHAQFSESNLLDNLIRFWKNSLIQQFLLSNLATY